MKPDYEVAYVNGKWMGYATKSGSARNPSFKVRTKTKKSAMNKTVGEAQQSANKMRKVMTIDVFTKATGSFDKTKRVSPVDTR